jgi:hypothetical protein
MKRISELREATRKLQQAIGETVKLMNSEGKWFILVNGSFIEVGENKNEAFHTIEVLKEFYKVIR